MAFSQIKDEIFKRLVDKGYSMREANQMLEHYRIVDRIGTDIKMERMYGRHKPDTSAVQPVPQVPCPVPLVQGDEYYCPKCLKRWGRDEAGPCGHSGGDI